jgi:hypothetical protein
MFIFQFLQAAVPFLIVGIPSYTGTVLEALLGPHSLNYINYWFSLRIWITLFNPLTTIYFIRPYRNVFVLFFRGQNYVTPASQD